MPDIEIHILFLAFVLLVLFIATVFYISEHYEFAVLFIILSPFISAFFVPNSPLADLNSGPTIGSYIRVAIVLTCGTVGFIKFLQTWPIHKGKISIQLMILILTISLGIASITYSIDAHSKPVSPFLIKKITNFVSPTPAPQRT